MQDKYLGCVGYGIGHGGAVADWFAVEDDGDVLPDGTGVFEQVAAQFGMTGKDVLEAFRNGRALRGAFRYIDVSSEILCQHYSRHLGYRVSIWIPDGNCQYRNRQRFLLVLGSK